MQADCILDYHVLVKNTRQKLNLLVRFESGPAPLERDRRPLNISLVIDRSGSMAGDKIDFTRQAAQFLVQNMGVNDYLSVVLYSDKVETLLEPEPVVRKDAINQRIASIKARGTTNLSGGWLEGCNMVALNQDTKFVNRVILMSDGLANRGVTDSKQLVIMANRKYKEGISTTTMGLGSDFNEDLMMDMATEGGGSFYFIESPEVTPLIFQKELQGLLNVAAQNLIVKVVPSQYINSINQLNAYPVQSLGSTQRFNLGDVFGLEVKAILLELSVAAIETPGEVELLTLEYEYDELLPVGVKHHSVKIPVKIQVQMEGDMPALPNIDVEQSVLLLRAANARKLAVKAADRGEFASASQVLKDAAAMIEESKVSDQRLDDERVALLQQSAELAKGKSGYGGYDRKTLATQAFYTMQSRHQDTVMLRVRELQRKGSKVDQSEKIATAEIRIEPRSGLPPTHASWGDKEYVLEGDLIRIGRSRHNEIVISGTGISRFHCQIQRQGGQLILEDLGSTNGTTINGAAIESPHVLSVGDVVYLSDEKLIFHDGPPSKSN